MNGKIGPIVVVSGISVDEAKAGYELRRRGLKIKHCSSNYGQLNFAVTLSQRLTGKLATENKLPVNHISTYANSIQLLFANQAVAIILRTSSIGAKLCWVAHDPRQNEVEDAVAQCSVSDPGKALSMINEYYGSQIALYYGFLGFYTRCLFPVMIGGGMLFLYQHYDEKVDNEILPLFCLGVVLWSTFFLEGWKRRCSELSYTWGTLGYEDMELTAELAKGASKEVGSKEARRALSTVAMLFLVYMQVLMMLYFNHIQSHAGDYLGQHWYTSIVPSVVYFALCSAIGAVFYPVSEYLNKFERHTTSAEAESSLVVKRFAFNFVNQFSALFFAAFWERDLSRVRSLSFYAFLTHAVTNELLRSVIPFWIHFLSKFNKPKAQHSTQDGQGTDGTSDWEAFMRKELLRPDNNLEDDYLEMALQFGHISLFAVAFPIAPLLAYANNLWEFRSDFSKLCLSRRPPVAVRSSIGAWQSCFEFVSFASVFTNCFLLALVSSHINTIIPSALHEYLNSDWGRLVAMMVVEHGLIALKIGIMLLVDDMPMWVKESIARDKLRAETERLQAFANNLGESIEQGKVHFPSAPHTPTTTKSNHSDAGSGQSDKHHMHEFDQQNDYVAMNSVTRKPASSAVLVQADLATAKLVKETSTLAGFNPLNLSLLISIPPILQHMGLNPFFYIPAAVLYFSYLQAAKDRTDRKAAIGIVSDPTLLKLVLKDLPSWVSDSENQRVEWFNSLLQKMWPQLSLAMEPRLVAQIQNVLDAQVLALRAGLTVKRCSLGTVSPKIVGIRFHETQESVVRVDVEIRWAGDPVVCITLGKYAFAPPVELTEVRLSAIVRVELLDLMPSMPCFRSLAITCMEPPQVHFSLKVASLDFMNMGPSDFNVTALVRMAIDSALSGIVVYPKKLLFPIAEEEKSDVSHPDGTHAVDSASTAAGVLYLTFEKGINLQRVGLFGSNPYVVALTDKGQSYRSKTVFGSRNPEWNETFEMMVFDPSTQIVEVQVMHSDPARGSLSLGRLHFGLSKVKASRSVECTVDLLEVDSGALVLRYEFIPLQTSAHILEDISEEALLGDDSDDDILYALDGPNVGDEEDDDYRNLRGGSDVLGSSLQGFNHQHSMDSPVPTRNAPLDRSISSEKPDQVPSPSTRRLGPLMNRSRIVMSQRFASRYSVGIVSVSMMHIRNLKVDSIMFQGSLKPFIELTIGEKTKRTKPVTDTAFPHFPEKFTFIVKHLTEQVLHVYVKSKRKVSADKILGTAEVSLADVVGSGGTLEQEYMLHGVNAESFVGLRLEVTASS